MNQKYYYNMDSLKFICSIFVVAIHTTFYIYQQGMATTFNYYSYRPLLEIAVPFFFAVSGFFISLKIREGKKEYILSYSKKIFSLYISFSVFFVLFRYSLLAMDRIIMDSPFWERAISYTESLTIIKLINGSIGSFHLWYLTSLLLACLLLHLFINYSISPNIILLASFLFYLAYMAEITPFDKVFLYGGVGKAFFYLSLGYFLGHKNLTFKHPIILFLLSISIFSVLYRISPQINTIFLILATLFLMVYCINNPGKPNFVSKLGKHSLKIYILHIFILEIINRIYYYSGHTHYSFKSYYFISTFLCIVLSIGLYKVVEKYFISFITNSINRVID